MHCTARFVCAAWLVVAAACSDDGLSVQDLNSSSTAAEGSSSGSASGNATTSPVTTVDSASITGTDDGPGGTTVAEPTDAGDTVLDESTVGTTGGPGDSTGTTDGTGTTGGSTTEGSTEGSTTGGSTTEACEPITEDASGIGVDCMNDGECPEGYTCQAFEGIVLQQLCQILCTQDCECPAGLTCIEVSDKSGSWHQCG
jgi:hypothetical protein